MNIFKRKNDLTQPHPLPMRGKLKKGYRLYAALLLAVAVIGGLSVTAFAAGDPVGVVNNLSDFIFGVIKAVGFIIAGWGVVQLGLSTQSHDPSQRSNGVLTLVGGLIVAFAKEILDLIMG